VNDDLAEQAVLSCCYQSPLALERAAAILTDADFANTAHQDLWRVLTGLRSEGKPTDALSVQTALSGNKRLMSIHLAIVTNPALPDTVEHHASTVHGFARRREVIAQAIRMRQRAEDLETDPQSLVSETVNVLTRIRDLGAPDIETQTLGELMSKPDEPYDWVIPDLLERMDRLVITGEEGLGKSVFLRQLALMGGAGIHPFSRDPMKPIRAHIIDLENTERHVKRQLRGMWLQAKTQGKDPSDRVAVDCRPGGIDICKDKDLSWVNRVLDATQPDLLVIGPLYKLAPRALQTDDHVAPVISALDSLRARGITLVLEAHAGHATTKGDERNMRPRGSAALMGWPEFGYGLRWNEMGDVDMVAWRGDRDARNWPLRIKRGGLWPWTQIDPRANDEDWQRQMKEFA
jgi:replicative DNA helicase